MAQGELLCDAALWARFRTEVNPLQEASGSWYSSGINQNTTLKMEFGKQNGVLDHLVTPFSKTHNKRNTENTLGDIQHPTPNRKKRQGEKLFLQRGLGPFRKLLQLAGQTEGQLGIECT